MIVRCAYVYVCCNTVGSYEERKEVKTMNALASGLQSAERRLLLFPVLKHSLLEIRALYSVLKVIGTFAGSQSHH